MSEFSIVVTVYNKEAELRRCLDSIKHQSFEDWETILIDDGSIDSSLEICREYENSDKRFRVISQQNRGYSGAKNTGIDYAVGNYILFVDADDFIEPLTLETAYRGMEEHGVDLVIGGVNVRIFDKGEQVSLTTGVPEENYFFHMKDLPVAGPYLWEVNGTLFYCAWSKVYRMDIIKAYGLKFDENLPVQEDVEFVYRYYYRCGDCMASNEVFYNYCRPVDKDDVGEKPQIDQHRYVEQSLISFLQVIYKFKYPEPYRQLMYEKTFEHYIKLSSKIFLPSTGLSVDEQKRHIKSMTDDFAFRFFCEKLGPVDSFWKRMSELSAEKDYEALYSEWARKITEGVVPPCT